ncbi:MAG: hypothetical protein ACRC7V_06055 [Lachnospiraceae bacterium]
MKKIDHIWTYYKIPILAFIIAVILISYFVFLGGKDKVAVILHVSFVNYYDDLSEKSEFYKGFIDAYPVDEMEQKVEFDAYNFFDLGKKSEYNNSYYQKIVAYLEAGTTDAIVCEYDNLMGIAQSGRLIDLQDERVIELYEQYKEHVVYITVDGIEIPVGIDISKNEELSGERGYANSVYIGISSNVKHIEQIKNFLEYLL